MRYHIIKTCLLVALLALVATTSGCQVHPPMPQAPPIFVPRVSHYEAPPRVVMHRYRYFPTAEVYF